MWKFADLIEREAHDLAIVETLVFSFTSKVLFFKIVLIEADKEHCQSWHAMKPGRS